MLDLIYITHLHPGRQKNLAFAFGLAKRFSAPLSLLPSSGLGDPNTGKMSIWRPKKNRQMSRTRMENLPLYVLGEPSQPAKNNNQSCLIIQRLVNLGFSILSIPYNQSFHGIHNVLFAGNTPGMTDHRIKHLIGALFLPKVFEIRNNALKRIHWNNISQIDEESPHKLNFNAPSLATALSKHEIDLIIYPVDASNSTRTTIYWQGLSGVQRPVLFLSLSSQKISAPKKTAYLTA